MFWGDPTYKPDQYGTQITHSSGSNQGMKPHRKTELIIHYRAELVSLLSWGFVLLLTVSVDNHFCNSAVNLNIFHFVLGSFTFPNNPMFLLLVQQMFSSSLLTFSKYQTSYWTSSPQQHMDITVFGKMLSTPENKYALKRHPGGFMDTQNNCPT